VASEARKERIDALRDRVLSLAEDDQRICELANRSFRMTKAQLEALAALPDEELRARGYEREEVEVMLEARNPMSQASYAVRMAHERMGMRIRKAPERLEQPTRPQVVMPTAQQPDPKRIVEVKEK